MSVNPFHVTVGLYMLKALDWFYGVISPLKLLLFNYGGHSKNWLEKKERFVNRQPKIVIIFRSGLSIVYISV